jgi:TorA maturation chaperone TorD
MSPAGAALAAGLELAGRLFLWGVRPDDLAAIGTIPDLAAHLPEKFGLEFQEESAADHYHLFGMNVFPYASAFLDDSRMLGGPVAEEALGFYLQGGFRPATTSESPDHLGHELAFTAHLLGEGQDDLLARFLHRHLLAWLLPLVQAVRQQGDGFYTALAELSLSLVVGCLEGSAPPGKAPFNPPIPPDSLLDDPETRLKDIAGYLLTPAYAGIFLSRDRITALGRQVSLPRGFGDRAQILSNLFHAGADYGVLEGTFGLLREEVRDWIAAYSAWEGSPQLAPPAGIWKTRAQSALEIVEIILQSV